MNAFERAENARAAKEARDTAERRQSSRKAEEIDQNLRRYLSVEEYQARRQRERKAARRAQHET
jgi:hypothetical protein